MRNHIVILSVEREKTTPKGELKRTNETYLAQHVEVLAEAEKRVLEYHAGNCDVNSVKRLPENYKEIINENEEKPFFLATLTSVYINEDGSEKELRYKVYVRADNITEAHSIMSEYIRQGLEDMQLQELKKTKIISLI